MAKRIIWFSVGILVALAGSAMAANPGTNYVGNFWLSDPTTPANTLKVNADGSINAASSISAPTPVPSTNISGTVTAGGTFQTILAANTTTRKGCSIENPTTATEPLLVYASTPSSPAAGASYSLGPGGIFNCASSNVVIGDAIAVTATTTGHAFTGNSQ